MENKVVRTRTRISEEKKRINKKWEKGDFESLHYPPSFLLDYRFADCETNERRESGISAKKSDEVEE